MSVDFTKLRSFVKIVDAGSVSRASGILHTAQPALSQQIAALEAHFRQRLLIRSNQGITPTEAGLVVYRHAQLILKQIEQAQVEVGQATHAVSGRVSIGLATYSTTSTLSLPILQRMAERHPGVTVHINDSFGIVLSELIMSGKMDIAVMYGAGPIKGVEMRPLFREELFLIAPPEQVFTEPPEEPVPMSALAGTKLLLPTKGHLLRRLIDESFARARTTPHVAAELESVAALGAAVSAGVGATILPYSVAMAPGLGGVQVRRLVRPATEATVSLCISDHFPLSEPATAALSVLEEILDELLSSRHPGVKPA
jgi:LysR family nitrogen assimilation transcriptional regulator